MKTELSNLQGKPTVLFLLSQIKDQVINLKKYRLNQLFFHFHN